MKKLSYKKATLEMDNLSVFHCLSASENTISVYLKSDMSGGLII